MAVTRLSGGITPGNGSDPRTFPAIWNATADVIEANEAAIDSLALTDLSGVSITSPVDNQLLTYNGTNWVNEAPATPDPITPSDLPAGSVLQVVQVVLPTTFSSGSTSYTDVVGLAASITPSATSSKILVTFDNRVSQSVNEGVNRTRLLRDSTAIYIGTASGSLDNEVQGEWHTGSSFITTITGTFLDSPNTTSSVTYKIQMRTTSGTFYVNRNDNDHNLRPASSVTLMEVAG